MSLSLVHLPTGPPNGRGRRPSAQVRSWLNLPTAFFVHPEPSRATVAQSLCAMALARAKCCRVQLQLLLVSHLYFLPTCLSRIPFYVLALIAPATPQSYLTFSGSLSRLFFYGTCLAISSRTWSNPFVPRRSASTCVYPCFNRCLRQQLVSN